MAFEGDGGILPAQVIEPVDARPKAGSAVPEFAHRAGPMFDFAGGIIDRRNHARIEGLLQ